MKIKKILTMSIAISFTFNSLLGGKKYDLDKNSQPKQHQAPWPNRIVSQCKSHENLPNKKQVYSTSHSSMPLLDVQTEIYNLTQSHIDAVLIDDQDSLFQSQENIKNKISDIKKTLGRKAAKRVLILMLNSLDFQASEKCLDIKNDKIYKLICLKIHKYNDINLIPPDTIISLLMEKINEARNGSIENTDIDSVKHLIERLIKQLYSQYTSFSDLEKIHQALSNMEALLKNTNLECFISTINEAINPSKV
ncbi:MAG: hypothetical protein LBI37_03520 [Puniceicoccales bacterium]|jgi:hypothetical protein|nr:hypothetical protein [Puniceicoccales bacterium]